MNQIYSYLHEPKKGNDKARVTRILCSNQENCDAYKSGGCILKKIALFSLYTCPYGKKVVSVGYTRRAKSHWKWVKAQRDLYGADNTKLKNPPDRILAIGDYYYLPYPQIDHDNNLPIKNNLIKKEDLTAEVLLNIYQHNPKALLTMEVIRSYQSKTVKKFVKDLHLFFPHLFELLKTKVPELEVEENSLVGRKALLKTLNKNIEVIHKKEKWFWDGEYLTTTEHHVIFLDIDNKEIQVRVKPTDQASVIISDESQVSSDTVILE